MGLLMTRSWSVFVFASTTFWVISARAEVVFRCSSATLRPGERVELTLDLSSDQTIQGFTAAVRYDPRLLAVVETKVADALLRSTEIEYYEILPFPEKGGVVIGCLADVLPPYDGNAIPPTDGNPLAFALVTVELAASARAGIIPFSFGTVGGTFDYQNQVSIASQGVPPDRLESGLLRVPIFISRGPSSRSRRASDTIR